MFTLADNSCFARASNAIYITFVCAHCDYSRTYSTLFHCNRFQTRQLEWAKVEDTRLASMVEDRGLDDDGT